jgi:hypothetical protein
VIKENYLQFRKAQENGTTSGRTIQIAHVRPSPSTTIAIRIPTKSPKFRKNRSDIPFKPVDKKMKPVHRSQVDKNFEIC